MKDKVIEKKLRGVKPVDDGREAGPWQLSDFPVKLRKRVTTAAMCKGISLSEMVQIMATEYLKVHQKEFVI